MGHHLIPHVGGWLALLVTLHFTVDWVFQSHDEAMRKPREWLVRARHCMVYAFVSEPLGKILLVAIDQIVHILFLLPVAYMMAAQP